MVRLVLICFFVSAFTPGLFSQINEKDMKFIEQAWDGGLLQLRTAELAKVSATTPDLKELAEKLIKDYETANAALKKIANDRHMNLAVVPGKSSQSKIDKLSNKKGKSFDSQYASLVRNEHKDKGELYEEAFNKCADAELKAWALQRWPVLAANELAAELAKEKIK